MNPSEAPAAAPAFSLGHFTLNALFAVLTLVAYLYQLPSSFFPFDGAAWYVDAAGLLALYLLLTALAAPFTLPTLYRRSRLALGPFLASWATERALEALLSTAFALALLQSGRLAGLPAAALLFASLHLALLFRDPALSLSTRLAVLAWNTLGFALSAALPWAGVTTLRHLVETLLGAALWSLPGLWLLPRLFSSSSAPASLRAARLSFNPFWLPRRAWFEAR